MFQSFVKPHTSEHHSAISADQAVTTEDKLKRIWQPILLALLFLGLTPIASFAVSFNVDMPIPGGGRVELNSNYGGDEDNAESKDDQGEDEAEDEEEDEEDEAEDA